MHTSRDGELRNDRCDPRVRLLEADGRRLLPIEQCVQCSNSLENVQHDLLLVQVELREPPERVVSICEAAAERHAVDPGVAHVLDPGAGGSCRGVLLRAGQIGVELDATCSGAAREREDWTGHLLLDAPGSSLSGVDAAERTRRRQRRDRRLENALDPDGCEAIRRVAHTSLRWTADPIARAARQIDAYDTIVRSSKRVPGGIRGTEYRDNRCPDSTGQVHRSGVACDEHIETFEDRGQSRQVGVAGNVDDSTVAERVPQGRDKRGVFWTARQHDRCAVHLRQVSRDFAESFRLPLLDRASTADLHSDEWL